MEKYPYTEENLIVRPYGPIFMAYRRVFKREFLFFGKHIATNKFTPLYYKQKPIVGDSVAVVKNKINKIIEENRKFVI